MAQNFNHHPRGSTPQGFEDLMGSLKSPGLTGPAVPSQHGLSTTQWPAQWQQNAAPGIFPLSMPHQISPTNGMTWNHNNHDMSLHGYVQFDQEEDDGLFTVDDTEILGQNGLHHSGSHGEVSGRVKQGPTQQPHFPPFPLPSLAMSSPLSLPPSHLSEAGSLGPAPIPKSPMASTTARAAELRAKLLASRGSRSRQGSPAAKPNELNNARKTQLLGIVKQQTNGNPRSQIKHQSDFVNGQQEQSSAVNGHDELATTATSLDNLMAEARNAADARRTASPLTNGKHANEVNNARQIESNASSVEKPDPLTRAQPPPIDKSRSVSELSEPGEIRSDPATPMRTEQPQLQKLPETSKALQDGQDEQEKIARQNEVKKAYQPLKNPKAQKPEPKLSAAQALPSKSVKAFQAPRKPSVERRRSVYEQLPTRQDVCKEHERDEYNRWHAENEDRRSSLPQTYASEHDFERDAASRRQKLTDDNSRRAAEYKRKLDAQRAHAREAPQNSNRPPHEVVAQDIHTAGRAQANPPKASRKASMKSNDSQSIEIQTDESRRVEQGIDSTVVSPRAQQSDHNEDVNDWLELTEFYDEAYRERRLTLFRKKRALDVQRAELEREEELELQERTQRSRAQSILTSGTPLSIARRHSTVNLRMPPPPLPLPFREVNQDTGMKVKDAALSAGLPASQKSSPKLKRQYAEDDLEPNRTIPAEKRARIEMSGPSSDERPLTSPSSARGERAFFRNEAPNLENRMSRYDSWAPRRSRSPEYRRRSLSPRMRRDYSPGPPTYRPYDAPNGSRKFDERSCYNCGERGHMLNNCTLPRRDAKEWPSMSRSYEQWVSPNYRGKNPIVKLPPSSSTARSPHPRPSANGRARGKGDEALDAGAQGR